MFYTFTSMTRSLKPKAASSKSSLSVRLGGWFQAEATGAGVIAIPFVVVAVLAAVVARYLLA